MLSFALGVHPLRQRTTNKLQRGPFKKMSTSSLSATSLPGGGSASVNTPARPTTHGLRSGPDLLYGPSRALDEILMWADRRHRGKGHEMRHVVGLLLATNRRREQLSRALMAWLLQAPAGAP